MISILQKARNEGGEVARANCADYADQLSQVSYDAGLEAGRRSVVAPSRFKWWVLGIFGGIALSGIWGALS